VRATFGGHLLSEGKMSFKVFNADRKVVTKKRIMQLLNKEYVGLDPKTLEIDDPAPLPQIFVGRGMGTHSLFRCWGTDKGTGEKYKAWGYVMAGVETTDKGVEVFSLIVLDV